MFAAPQPATIDGVTFADRPNKILVPVREVAHRLHIPFGAKNGRMSLRGKPLAAKGAELANGTRLIPVAELANYGVRVVWDGVHRRDKLFLNGRVLYVRRSQKRVTIDKTSQTIRALQGTRTVLRSRVSTGTAAKNTPNGLFHIKPYRARIHRSSLYNGAPMPYAVQVVNDIFVHGAPNVKGTPASHGCIRLPVSGANPARFFYQWAETGTPVVIRGHWTGRPN